MSSEALLVAARNLALLAIFMALIPLLLMQLRVRQANRQRVRQRLSDSRERVLEAREVRLANGWLERWQLRAGVRLKSSSLLLWLSAAIALVLLALVLKGLLAMLLVCFSLLIAMALYWNWLYQKRQKIIFSSLPELIDSTLRGIDAGRSLEQALDEALADAPDVFEPLAFRVRSALQAGRDYTWLLDDFAHLYRVPPLVMVAVALRTASRFGSAIRPVLKRVSQGLRSREEMRREFIAATAETRFTAVAFAVLPVLIGAFLVGSNQAFREVLLGTDAGLRMMGLSLLLIATGSVVIFRMVQGVGRG